MEKNETQFTHRNIGLESQASFISQDHPRLLFKHLLFPQVNQGGNSLIFSFRGMVTPATQSPAWNPHLSLGKLQNNKREGTIHLNACVR